MKKLTKILAAVTAVSVVASSAIFSSAAVKHNTWCHINARQTRGNNYGHSWTSKSARSYYDVLKSNDLLADGYADNIYWEGDDGIHIFIENSTSTCDGTFIALLDTGLSAEDVSKQIQGVYDKNCKPIITQLISDSANHMYLGTNYYEIMDWIEEHSAYGPEDYALTAYNTYQFLNYYTDIYSYKLRSDGSVDITIDVKGTWPGLNLTVGNKTIFADGTTISSTNTPGVPYQYLTTDSCKAKIDGLRDNITSDLYLNAYETGITRFTFNVKPMGRNNFGRYTYTLNVPVYFSFAGHDKPSCRYDLTFTLNQNRTLGKTSIKKVY